MKITLLFAALAAVLFASAATVEELNARFGANGRVSFRADENGEPIVDLKDANGLCSVKLRGAHVTDCRFAGDEHPLLFVPKMGYVPVSGPRDFIHGGVPLLWPWFGSSGAPQLGAWRRWLNKVGFSLETQGPFHATARLSLFSVKAVTATADETAIELTLGPCAEVSAYTPGDFVLTYRITLGDHRLGLSLTTRNVGDTTFRYREGYHPYFAVSDCYKLTLAGVDGCRYESDRDLPCDVTHIWQGGPVPEWPGCDLFRFGQERSVLTLTDPVWKREIVLSTTGGRDVVTWCQDVKGASKGTMNIRPEECRNYFCIEPSNFYRESEIALESGESHTLETVISVRPVK